MCMYLSLILTLPAYNLVEQCDQGFEITVHLIYCAHVICYRNMNLPALASGFLLGTCVHPLAIGARSCCGAVCERGRGERGRGERGEGGRERRRGEREGGDGEEEEEKRKGERWVKGIALVQ